MSLLDNLIDDTKKQFSTQKLQFLIKNKPVTVLMTIFTLITAIAIVWSYFTLGLTRDFNAIVLLGITLIFIPITYIQYMEFSRIQQMETYFPNFLRDIADSRRAGVTLAEAIRNSTKTYYGSLSPEVKKMSDQLSWGVPFQSVLRKFSERTKSSLIKRDVEMILEAYRAGGSIADILDAITADTLKIKELQQETKSTLKIQVNTIYILFFTFLAIIIMLQNVLLPSLPSLTGISKIVGSAGSTVPLAEFNIYLLHFVFIQGFFIGLIAGEVSEGSVRAGLKHSLFLMIMGFAIMQIFVTAQPLSSILITTLSTTPIELDLLTDLGVQDVAESITVRALVDELNELGRKEEAKRRLVKVTYDDMRFQQQAACENCAEDVVFVTEDQKELIVKEPTQITVEIQARRGKIIIYIS